MKCKYCGTKIKKGIEVCPGCGRIYNNPFGNKKKVGIISITAAVVIAIFCTIIISTGNDNMDVKVIDEAKGEYMIINAPTDFSLNVALNEEEDNATFNVKDHFGNKTKTSFEITENNAVISAPESGYQKDIVYTVDVSDYGNFTNEEFDGASKITFITGNKETEILDYKDNIYELDKEVIVKDNELIIDGAYNKGDIIVTDSDKNGINESYKLVDPMVDTDQTYSKYTVPDADELYDNYIVLKNVNIEDTYYKYKSAVEVDFFEVKYFNLIDGKTVDKYLNECELYIDDVVVDMLDGFITTEISEGIHTFELKWEYEGQEFNYAKQVKIIDETKLMEDIDFALLYEFFRQYFSNIDICALNDADGDGYKEMFVHQEYGGSNPIDIFFDCGGVFAFDDYGDAKTHYLAPTGVAASAHLKKYENKIILNDGYSTAGMYFSNYYYWKTYGAEKFATINGSSVDDYSFEMEYDAEWEGESIAENEFNNRTNKFTEVEDESEDILNPVIETDDPESTIKNIEEVYDYRGAIAESIHLNIDEDSYEETLLILHDHSGPWVRDLATYETIGSGEPYDMYWGNTSGTISLLLNPDNNQIKVYAAYLGDAEYEFVDISTNDNFVELPIKNSGVIIKLNLTSDGIDFVY